MRRGVDAPFPPELPYDTRGTALFAFPLVACFPDGHEMLRVEWREREHSRTLRARAWSAVDHTLSAHRVSVVLHGCHPQSLGNALRIESLAIVQHRETDRKSTRLNS